MTSSDICFFSILFLRVRSLSPTNPAECCESQVHTRDCIVIGNRQNGCVVGYICRDGRRYFSRGLGCPQQLLAASMEIGYNEKC